MKYTIEFPTLVYLHKSLRLISGAWRSTGRHEFETEVTMLFDDSDILGTNTFDDKEWIYFNLPKNSRNVTVLSVQKSFCEIT